MYTTPSHEFFTQRGRHIKQAKKDGIIFVENGSSPKNSFFVVFPRFLLDHISDTKIISTVNTVIENIFRKVSIKYKGIRGSKVD